MTDGGVIWITGLSGVGKTTVATLVRDRLTAAGTLPVLIDGDRMRQAMPDPPGYERADRERLARTYAGLAAEFSRQGHLVVCATVSLFHSVHAWNRAHVPRYLEVLLQAPLEELRRRGVRPALYGGSGPGHVDGEPHHGRSEPHGGGPADVVGLGIRAEFPVAPHLRVDTTTTDPEQAADLVVRAYTGQEGTHGGTQTPGAGDARLRDAHR